MFGEKISQQDDYNYLGLLFNYNGIFYKARKNWLIKHMFVPIPSQDLDFQRHIMVCFVFSVFNLTER
jgi:hypothetical protein